VIRVRAKAASKAEASQRRQKRGGGGSNRDDAFRDYAKFDRPARMVAPHQYLAIERGRALKKLRVEIVLPDVADFVRIMEKAHASLVDRRPQNRRIREFLREAFNDGSSRLLRPFVRRKVKQHLALKSEEAALRSYTSSLRGLLLQQPARGFPVLGIDPGFKHGCKFAAISSTGDVLQAGVIYPTPPKSDVATATSTLQETIKKHRIRYIAIGNGTAHRECCNFVARLIGEVNKRNPSLKVEYTVVSEAGASIYSVSKHAQQSLPDFQAALRGAISIARRLQDPLAELVKIDPSALGVGMYQKDVSATALAKVALRVVESCVHFAGVDLNTASEDLLSVISGIGSCASCAHLVKDAPTTRLNSPT